MSDILEATTDHLMFPCDGKECRFDFLNAYDRADLLRADLKRRQDARTDRKVKLVENLKLAGIGGSEMFAELENFDDQYPVEVTEEDWVRFCNSLLNRIAIYEKSLRSLPAEDRAKVASSVNLPIDKFVQIVGLSMVDKGDVDPNVPSPATVFSTPGQRQTSDSPSPDSSTGSE